LIYKNRVKDEVDEQIPGALIPKKSTWNEGGKNVWGILSLGPLKLKWGIFQIEEERESKLDRFQSCRLCVAAAWAERIGPQTIVNDTTLCWVAF
jgi:hypothetical protein